jgi:ATP-dependent RNA helicase DDX21
VKKVKKVKKESSDSDAAAAAAAAPEAAAEPAAPAANPLALDNFKLSEPVKSLLRAKGIEALFDIQAQCLTPLLEGNDVVGRARTGCGKTLAFVLPIVERLCAGATAGKRTYGRAPSVVVLAPTRELAKQVGSLGDGDRAGWGVPPAQTTDWTSSCRQAFACMLVLAWLTHSSHPSLLAPPGGCGL